MDDNKKGCRRSRHLPHTARISEKIMEYYTKFGQERDLEKFMRLYSPTSSQNSNDQHPEEGCTRSHDRLRSTSSTDSENNKAVAGLDAPLVKKCSMASSTSLPNIDVHWKAAEEGKPSEDPAVPLKTNQIKQLGGCNENLITPNKLQETKQTQTPESVVKSHKRLEWDSLGDVGYKKSMSTSNISTFERSILREFFRERSIDSEPSPSTSTSKSKEQEKEEQSGKAPNIKTHMRKEHSTPPPPPPLASSTLMIVKSTKRERDDVCPKMISQGTSTSLKGNSEKCVQTSLLNTPILTTQEVQVNMSSSTSILGGTATPSSFEYYSSRSSRSHSSTTNTTKPSSSQQSQKQHPFIASLTDLLMQRKALTEQNRQQHRDGGSAVVKQLQAKFQSAIGEDKENSMSTSSSTTSCPGQPHATELDVGIHLICSVIEAKSLNDKQKKKLVRDIVKRISRITATDNTSQSQSAESGQPININAKTRLEALQKDKTADLRGTHHDPINNSNNKVFEPIQRTIEPEIGKGPNVVPTKPPIVNKVAKPDKDLQIELISNKKERTNISNTSSYRRSVKETAMAVVPTTTVATNTEPIEASSSGNSATTGSSVGSTLTTSSKDVTTQKAANIDLRSDSNTDFDQATMNEWLNPLTQSEIEYEQKRSKQLDLRQRNTASTAKRSCNLPGAKEEYGRSEQLDWIENEIQRLECLKHLLLKDKVDNDQRTSKSNRQKKPRPPAQNITTTNSTETLYDSVYSEKCSKVSTEELVQEIEVIVEESNEDVVNLEDKLKRTKQRKRETQIMYEQPHTHELEVQANNARYRTMRETITINEEQVLPKEQGTSMPLQRGKIDTPSDSNESGSVRALAQQRKREFMEAYKNKKRHNEALKQQQEDRLKQQQKGQQWQLYRHEEPSTSAAANTGHFSTSQTVHRQHQVSQQHEGAMLDNYSQNKTPPPPPPSVPPATTAAAAIPPPLSTLVHEAISSHVIYSTAAPHSAQQQAEQHQCTSTSSTSMFCISSEVSIPMGSQNSSSTTTHQYDDVAAAGVAVQTNDSLLRSRPIYGPQRNTRQQFIPQKVSSSTACVQVKPKGIAYVIHFDNKGSSENISTANIVPTATTTAFTFAGDTQECSERSLLTLQDHLQRAKPEFLEQSKERKALLNQLQTMRQARERKLREIIENSSMNSLDRRLRHLPPPATQKIRILNTKEMKALTNRRFARLPEVVARQQREREERHRRSNRILRDIFNRRLQKRVRSGKLSLNHSKTVI